MYISGATYNYNNSYTSMQKTQNNSTLNSLGNSDDTIRQISNYSFPTILMISSWLVNTKQKSKVPTLPSIRGANKYLVKILEQPLESMQKTGVVNPKEIDKILTSLVGKSNVSDLYFYEKSVKNPEGRVKEYIVDKYKYVLEARMSKNKPVVRFFSRQPNKNKRFYLTNRGEFQINAYSRYFAHLKGDKNAIDWINKK